MIPSTNCITFDNIVNLSVSSVCQRSHFKQGIVFVFFFQKNPPSRKNSSAKSEKTEMPLYPQSILKKPTDFPPVPFNLDEKVIEDDNESLDIVLSKSDLNDFADFDRPTAKPGMKCHYQLFHN